MSNAESEEEFENDSKDNEMCELATRDSDSQNSENKFKVKRGA